MILDGNFIFAAVKFKIDIRDRLQKLFQGNEVKLYVLQSIIQELEQVGVKAQHALEFAKACCEVINDEKVVGETAGERLVKLIGDATSIETILHNNSSRTLSQVIRDWAPKPPPKPRSILWLRKTRSFDPCLALVPASHFYI